MYVCGTLWSTFYRCLYVDIPAFCQEIRLALNLQLYYSATLWRTFNGFTSSLLFALYTEFINLNSCLGCCIAVLSLLQWHILGWGYGVYQNRSNMDIYYSHASLYTHQKYSGFTFLSCIIRFFSFCFSPSNLLTESSKQIQQGWVSDFAGAHCPPQHSLHCQEDHTAEPPLYAWDWDCA